MTEPSRPSPAQPSRRFLSLRGSPQRVFRFVVVGILLSTGIGVAYALGDRPAFVSSFPGAGTPAIYAAFLVVGGVGLVALLGLLWWWRWALWLYGGLTLASIALDVMARAPVVHQLAVIVGAAAVFLLAYMNRTQFGGRMKPSSLI